MILAKGGHAESLFFKYISAKERAHHGRDIRRYCRGSRACRTTAAYFLDEAGKRVLILEKESLPRYKTCGGGLSIRFLQEQFPFSFDAVLESQAKALSYAFDGRTITIPIKQGAVGMVMRDKFDAHILANSNAEICQGAAVRRVFETPGRVMVETRAGARFEGRYLIGADGANSVVARSLGLRRDKTLAAAIEAEAPVAPEIMRRFADRPVFIFGEIKLGYLWIFPKSEHLSVGIAALHPKRGSLQAALNRVMGRYGISLEGVPLHGHPIPIYTHRESIATPRTLLVGDAAGLVDPLSGEGIRYAIKSGRLASTAILSGYPERYPRMVFWEIGLNHTLALGVAQFFYRFPSVCLRLGAPNPFTTQTILDLLSDRASTAEVMLRAVFTLPVYGLAESLAALAGRLGGDQHRERLRSLVYENLIEDFSA